MPTSNPRPIPQQGQSRPTAYAWPGDGISVRSTAARQNVQPSYPSMGTSEPTGRTGRLDLPPTSRAQARIPHPKSYHGPHFEKGASQEKAWNERGSTTVWEPKTPGTPSDQPGVRGRSHSIDAQQGHLKEPKYTGPFKKNPQPYTPRVKADYASYKTSYDGMNTLRNDIKSIKDLPVGKKTVPTMHTRAELQRGLDMVPKGIYTANVAAQSRQGQMQKHPWGVESLQAVETHVREGRAAIESAQNFRNEIPQLHDKIAKSNNELDYQYGGVPRPPPPSKAEIAALKGMKGRKGTKR